MDIRSMVKQEYDEIRDYFQDMNIASFQRGDWFASFVARVLASHANRSDEEHIMRRYRGDTPNEQAKHAIETASRTCAIAGGLTSSLASAATLSVVPTLGFSFPGVGATIGLSVMTDIGFSLRTHTRAIYDLSVLHGATLAPDEVEDCYLIFINAMEGDTTQPPRSGPLSRRKASKIVPYNARMIVRSGLRAFFEDLTKSGGGNRLVRKLVERVNLRTVLPGVNVAMAGPFNRRFTQHVLGIADRHMRWRGAVVQPLLALYNANPELDPLWIFQALIIMIESANAAEWNRRQLDALRYCQSFLGLTDEDLAPLDAWFMEDVGAFTKTLPAMDERSYKDFIEVLVVVAAMSPDTRHDVSFAEAIAHMANGAGLPVNAGRAAQHIGAVRSMLTSAT
jgi:hypothetical protein